MKLKRLMLVAMLTAMAIVLSIVDSLIPISVYAPGVKLGLANVIILIMLYEFKAWEALLTDILRIILAALLRGNLLSPTFLMSLSGGALSFLIMWLFTRVKIFSPIGVSVLGAVFHCIGQIAVCWVITSLDAIVYYLPFIAILSIATGILSGIIARIYLKRSITQKFLPKEE